MPASSRPFLCYGVPLFGWRPATLGWLWVWILCLAMSAALSAAPPVVRSTYYDGVVSYANQFAAHGAFTLNTPAMTIEAWVYRMDATRCETIVSHGFQNSYWLGFCPRLRFYRSGGFSADADVEVPARQWTHVAASYDGTRVRFYIDGVLAGDKVLAHGTAKVFNALTLGADFTLLAPNAERYVFRGYLDEIRLWNTARTQSQIQDFRFAEPRGLPELMVAFPDAGSQTTLPDAEHVSEIAAWRESGFGILPTRLVIPKAVFPIVMDGTLRMDTEYAGAEQMVIRYSDGKLNPDGVVYLVYEGNTNFATVHMATSSLKYPTVPGENSGLGVYVHGNGTPNAVRSSADFSIAVPLSGASTGVHYETGGFTLPLTPGASTWQTALAGCQGEFHPACIELSIAGPLWGGATPHRLMLQHYGVTSLSDAHSVPGNASGGSPASWAEVAFGDSVDVPTRSAQVLALTPVAGSWDPDRRDYTNYLTRTIRFYSGDSSATGAFVEGYSGGSAMWVGGTVRADRLVTVQVLLHPGDEIQSLYFTPQTGARLIATNAPGEYVFSLCDGTNACNIGVLTLGMRPELGPVAIYGASPSNPVPVVTIRDHPLKQRGGGTLRVFGTNLHDQIEFYAANCPSNQVLACLATGDSFQLNVVGRDPDRSWMDLEVPEVARRWWNFSVRLWARDRFRTRDFPGVEWNTADGANGYITFTPPPWPQLYGFEYPNTGGFTSPEEFEAVFGESIFTYIPLPPFKVRDPYYFAFWWWLWLALSDANQGGSCHGFAGTSQLYYRGLLPLSLYDNALSGGPSGVHFPAGFPGVSVGDHEIPYGAPKWSGFDLFHAFEPRSLWAQIRVFMMCQFSQEALDNTISQVRFSSSLGSDPVEQLNYLRSGTSGHVLCFNPGGIGEGHCVVPYQLDADKGFDAAVSTEVDKPGYTMIRVYDNNRPEQVAFMEIAPRSAGGRYTFRLDSSSVWSSQSLTRTPIGLFTGARHAPGASFIHDGDLLFRLATASGVRAEAVGSGASRLGFDAAGQFHDEYPGARAVAPLTGPTNRNNTGFFAFFPPGSTPAKVNLRVYGSNYAFHAGQDFLSLQCIASNAVPGASESLEMLAGAGGRFQGLRLRSATPARDFTPMVCQTFDGTNRTVLRLDGLRLPNNTDLEMAGLDGEPGVRVVNRSPGALSFSIKFDAVDGTRGVVQDAVIESLLVPPGAAAAIKARDLAGSGLLTVELDLDNDGIVDRVLRQPSEYVLTIRGEGMKARIEWRVREGEAILETSPSLFPGAWTTVEGVPSRTGTLRGLTVPASAASGFFRLRR
jgi:hypothetical protein